MAAVRVHEYEGNAERDLSEENGERESRKQIASDKCVSAGHKVGVCGPNALTKVHIADKRQNNKLRQSVIHDG